MEYYLGEILAFAFPRIPYGTEQCSGQLLTIQTNSALFALIGTFWGGNGTTNFGIPNLCGRSMIGLGQPHTNSGAIAGTLNWTIGNLYGTDTYQISQLQLPIHTHAAVFTPTYDTPTTPTQAKNGGNPTSVTDANIIKPCGTGSGNSAYVQVSSAQGNQTSPTGNYLAMCWNTKNNLANNAYVDADHAGTLSYLGGVGGGGGSGGITGGTVQIGGAGSSAAITINDPGAGVNFCIVTSGVFPSFQ
jgi:microcystin-dependent protein